MKINFIFSIPFERALLDPSLSGQENLLTKEIVDNKIRILDFFWETSGRDIVQTIEQITGYTFQKKEIDCYINSKISVSDPFCLKVREDYKMKNSVIHELIHIIFKQNKAGETEKAKKYRSDFEKENVITINHIILDAIHFLLTEKLFPDQLDMIQQKKNPYYARSWEIVRNMGAQKIVDLYLR